MNFARIPLLLALAVAVLAAMACSSGGGEEGDNRWEADPIGDYPYPVEMLTNEAPSAEGRHYGQGEFQGYNTTTYNTNPPTSGRHIGELVQRGFYDERIPDEVAVHHMEHGYSVVWFNCMAEPALDATQCGELRDELSNLVQQEAGSFHVIGFPDPEIPQRIALTAWQFMDTMETFEEARVRTFIETFECHYDPEGGC